MFSEIAEIALLAAPLGQFLQFLKTRVILILNFTRPHAITHTNWLSLWVHAIPRKLQLPFIGIHQIILGEGGGGGWGGKGEGKYCAETAGTAPNTHTMLIIFTKCIGCSRYNVSLLLEFVILFLLANDMLRIFLQIQ